MALRSHKPFTLTPADGGALATAVGIDEAGLTNYVVKTNLRRFHGNEILREGDEWFAPNASKPVAGQSTLPADVIGMWGLDRPNGDRALIAATRTTIYKYGYTSGAWSAIGSGFSTAGKRWEAESLDGYLILNNGVDLPVTYRVEDATVSPINELREMGVVCVGTIAVYNGFLLCADITEIQSTSMVTWMTGSTPYGSVPAGITNRIRYKVIWSDYGNPRNWAVTITGTIQAAAKTVVILDYPSQSFAVGTKLAVVGAGPDGGVLGGQVGIDDGVPITALSGSSITLSTGADVTLTYPLKVSVLRFADTSSFCGSSSIQDDSSAIVRIMPLKGLLIVYRETGIFYGRYTAVVEAPFIFKPLYYGRNVPAYSNTIIELNGESHVYATENRFYSFDGTSQPELFKRLDLCRNLFFTGLNPGNSDLAFAEHNPITKELFFFCPTGVLAYDYVSEQASFIDETYSSAAYVRKPGVTNVTKFVFLLSKGPGVLFYGENADGNTIYTRRGAPITACLRAGLGNVTDDFDEKDLVTYVPHITFVGSVVPVTVKLLGCDNTALVPELLCSVVIEDASIHNLVETFFRNIYFQDEISFTSSERVEISARTWKFLMIDSQSATRI